MRKGNTKQTKKASKNIFLKFWRTLSNSSFVNLFRDSFFDESIETEAKILLTEFHKLKQISNKRKKELEPEIKKHFLDIAERSRSIRFIRWLIEFLLYTSLITLVFPFLITATLYGQPNVFINSLNYITVLIPIYMLFGMLLGVYIYQSTSGLIRSKPYLNSVIDLAVKWYEYIASIEGAALLLIISENFINYESHIWTNLAVAFLILIAGFFCSYKILRYITSFIEKKTGDYYFKTSQSLVTMRIFEFLRFLNRPSSYSLATKKIYIIYYIEAISKDISNTLSVSFKTSNYQFNYWLKDNADGIVRALDQKKELLINSNTETISKIEKDFANMLIWFLTDDWNKLEKADKSKELQISWKSKLIEFLKIIPSSIAPFLAVYLIQNLSIANSTLISYLYIVSIFWVIINFVLVIDPTLNEKIRVAKDISDIFNKSK